MRASENARSPDPGASRVPAELLRKHSAALGVHLEDGRALTAPTICQFMEEESSRKKEAQGAGGGYEVFKGYVPSLTSVKKNHFVADFTDHQSVHTETIGHHRDQDGDGDGDTEMTALIEGGNSRGRAL